MSADRTKAGPSNGNVNNSSRTTNGTGGGGAATSAPPTAPHANADKEHKEPKLNPKMSKALSTSAKRWVFFFVTFP